MEFVDKYLMPHKWKIVLLLILNILVIFSLPKGQISNLPAQERLAVDGEVLISLIFFFGIYAYIGWEGRRKLGYTWKQSLFTGIIVGALVIILNIIVDFIVGKEPGYAQELISQLGFAHYLILQVATLSVPALLALVGHAAAKYLAPKITSSKAELGSKHKK